MEVIMKNFKELSEKELSECTGGKRKFSSYKFGYYVGSAVRLAAPVIIPIFCA